MEPDKHPSQSIFIQTSNKMKDQCQINPANDHRFCCCCLCLSVCLCLSSFLPSFLSCTPCLVVLLQLEEIEVLTCLIIQQMSGKLKERREQAALCEWKAWVMVTVNLTRVVTPHTAALGSLTVSLETNDKQIIGLRFWHLCPVWQGSSATLCLCLTYFVPGKASINCFKMTLCYCFMFSLFIIFWKTNKWCTGVQ